MLLVLYETLRTARLPKAVAHIIAQSALDHQLAQVRLPRTLPRASLLKAFAEKTVPSALHAQKQ